MDVLKQLTEAGYFFRLENDEQGYYLSVIDRSKFPRIWVDNEKDDLITVIAENIELHDQVIEEKLFLQPDWICRWHGSITEVLMEAQKFVDKC